MFNSLDDLKELQQKPVSLMSVANFMAEKAHLENFVELVKQMLQLDPTQRRTLSQNSDKSESTQRPLSENHASTISSCVAERSQQKPPTLSEEENPTMAHIKPLQNLP
ncbi:proteoglycan 4-like isoform X1 [Lates japonicus]|uniref:Proteoglycan 4-like isoform X1 n=1 Tax=Lates japonicus TaxID=270547 RepID=A0AAD3RM13_LATJO|nr:proteoglycan 4-like isoform X1 [Lates japonicus]